MAGNWWGPGCIPSGRLPRIRQARHPRNGEVMKTSPLSDAIELAQAVIGDHAHGRWAGITERFDETMCAGLTEEGLAEARAYLAGIAGAHESHGDNEAIRAGEFTITKTPLVFEDGPTNQRFPRWRR